MRTYSKTQVWHSPSSSLNDRSRTTLLFHSDPSSPQGGPHEAGETAPSTRPSQQGGCRSLFMASAGPAQSPPFLHFIFMHSLATELKRKLKSPLKCNQTKFIKILQVIISPKSFLNKNKADFKIQRVSV